MMGVAQQLLNTGARLVSMVAATGIAREARGGRVAYSWKVGTSAVTGHGDGHEACAGATTLQLQPLWGRVLGTGNCNKLVSTTERWQCLQAGSAAHKQSMTLSRTQKLC